MYYFYYDYNLSGLFNSGKIINKAIRILVVLLVYAGTVVAASFLGSLKIQIWTTFIEIFELVNLNFMDLIQKRKIKYQRFLLKA